MAAHRREGGQVLILGVLGLTLVLVIGVIVVDFGMWFSGRASVLNAMDQASTAASLKLPTDGAGAEAVALQYAQDNDFDIAPGDVDVTFRCVVGDRNLDGQPDRFDIPAVCPQLTSATFTCINKLCYSLCAFSPAGPPTPRCNTVVVQGQKTVEFGFAPIFGVAGAQAPGFVSAACRGACGGPPTLPLDLVVIIDRTYSMNTDDMDKARKATNAILQLFDPEVQHVALGLLPQSIPSNDCVSVSNISDPGNWIVTDLLDDYQLSDGSPNTASEIVADVQCVLRSTITTPSTDLGDPLKAAKDFLQANGRPGVKKGIIFVTDGAANQPQTQHTGLLNCGANAAVTTSSGDNNGFERVASGINPAGACADGGDYAEDVDSGTGISTTCTSTQKDRHIFRDYNISLPAGATVAGIEVRLDAWADDASSSPRMCAELSWNGGTTWTTVSRQTPNLTTGEATYLLGSSSDTWGHTWSASDLSNVNFRVRITDRDSSSSSSRDYRLDWAAVRVHYTGLPYTGLGPCDYANQQATAAKAVDPPIEIFTIGFGIEGETCNYETSSSLYDGEDVTMLLADMATDSDDDGGDGPGGLGPGCDSSNAATKAAMIASENSDGDHFLCLPKTDELVPIFRQAAEQLAGGSRLIKLPPSMLP